MEKRIYFKRLSGMVKWFLPFYILTLLPLSAGAQGLPLIRNFTALEYGGHNRNYDIEIGDDGTVYVANFEGMLYYDRAQWRLLHTPNNRRVTVVYRDSKNTIWVGGYKYIARLQKQENGELYMLPFGKKDQFSGEVMEIFEDDASLLFVASDNNLYEVKGWEASAVPTISLKKRLNTEFRPSMASDILSLDALQTDEKNAVLKDITQTEELDGGLQVKVKRDQGLIIADSDGRDLYTLTEANGLCSNQVAYVAYDKHGVLWGATANGIFSIELPSAYSYFLPKDGLTGRVHTITAFHGKIYVGDSNGLYVIDAWQYKRLAGINNICWQLCPYREELFAATSSGIYKVTANGNVSRLTSYATISLLIDGDKIYAGEPDGVYCYQLNNAQRSKINDLSLVTEIGKDERGALWFKNVHHETEGQKSASEKSPIANLSSHFLMPLSNIEVKAQYQYGNHVWIGGDEILAVIDTDKKDLETLSDWRTIRFCSIVMGGDSVLWGGYGKTPSKLNQLDSNEGNLHFFYALNYAPLSGKTLYRYRLNNDRWSAWSERQDIEFLNLPYGSFTLSLQARLANGELSKVASIDFSIAYPLLMRWYMVVLYFIAFAYLVYLLFRYRLKRLQKDKMKLEQIVEERTADLRNAQNELIRQEKMATVGKLTEGLIDRILNPMNFIIYFSKMSGDLLKDLKENFDHNQDKIDQDDYEDSMDVFNNLAEVQQNLDKYGQSTTRILKSMEEMLKDRTGGYVDIDLQYVLQQNKLRFGEYFAKEIEQYHIQTVFSLPSGAMPLHGNPDMLGKVFMNLLGNSVYAVVKKFQKAPYNPEVSLTATVADNRYILKIRDNGLGIDDKILEKIFDPFFTTKTTDEATGLGLYLSREIIQNHKGDISAASAKGEYTEFTIILPTIQTT